MNTHMPHCMCPRCRQERIAHVAAQDALVAKLEAQFALPSAIRTNEHALIERERQEWEAMVRYLTG